MTRIIAGFAGSLGLTVPPFGTRPTSDRVREAIFSALEARDAIDGMRVLDLYSGSGALGLEAASRGARHVTLVDRTIQTSKANAAKVLKQAGRDAPTVVTTGQPVQAFLNSALNEWDLVFMDPPYDMGLTEVTHNLEALAGLLAAGGIAILERSSRTPAPEWPDGLELDRRKDYGDTALYWLSPSQPV
jgi:16S rRNA (guanine966-N2)-methyltransferase